MRWDYLNRFYDRFKEDGGFKRMLSMGFNCKNTYINYTPTFTAVPAFGIIKAMQMNYIYYHHTIALNPFAFTSAMPELLCCHPMNDTTKN